MNAIVTLDFRKNLEHEYEMTLLVPQPKNRVLSWFYTKKHRVQVFTPLGLRKDLQVSCQSKCQCRLHGTSFWGHACKGQAIPDSSGNCVVALSYSLLKDEKAVATCSVISRPLLMGLKVENTQEKIQVSVPNTDAAWLIHVRNSWGNVQSMAIQCAASESCDCALEYLANPNVKKSSSLHPLYPCINKFNPIDTAQTSRDLLGNCNVVIHPKFVFEALATGSTKDENARLCMVPVRHKSTFTLETTDPKEPGVSKGKSKILRVPTSSHGSNDYNRFTFLARRKRYDTESIACTSTCQCSIHYSTKPSFLSPSKTKVDYCSGVSSETPLCEVQVSLSPDETTFDCFAKQFEPKTDNIFEKHYQLHQHKIIRNRKYGSV